MRKLVSTLGLGLLIGFLGACGSDSGTPHPDGGSPDGGKSGGDGGGSSEIGHSALDAGNQGESSPVDVGVADQPIPGDSGIDARAIADAGSAVEVQVGSDQAQDTSLHPVIVDGGAADAGTLDVTGDLRVGVDGGSVDTGSLNEVGFDTPGPLDGTGLSLVIPQAGEEFSPPLPNAKSLPSGGWYCDMGTVHWAQGEQGTGTCPICGMALVQKS